MALASRDPLYTPGEDYATQGLASVAPAPPAPGVVHPDVVIPEPTRSFATGQDPAAPLYVDPNRDAFGALIHNYGPDARAAQDRYDAQRNVAQAVPVGPLSAQDQALVGGGPPGRQPTSFVRDAPPPPGPPAAPSGPAAAPNSLFAGAPPASARAGGVAGGSGGGAGGKLPRHWQSVLDAGDAEAKAVRDRALSESLGATLRADAYKEHAQQQQALETARQEHEADRQARAAKAAGEVEALAKDAAETKIDPKRFYADMNTGTRVANILGGALGGFNQRVTGGRNTFLEDLDRQHQTEIDAQKANLANKWRGVDAAKGSYASMLQRFGDERSAELASKIQLNEIAATKLQGLVADSDSVAFQKNGAVMLEGMNKANASLKAQFIDRQAAQAAAAAAAAGAQQNKAREQYLDLVKAGYDPADAAKVTGYAYGKVGAEDVRGIRKNDAEHEDKRAASSYQGPDGQTYLASSPDSAKKIHEVQSAVSKLERLNNEVDSLRSGDITPERQARLRSIRGEYVSAIATAKNSGILNPGEAERYEKEIGDPDAWMDWLGRGAATRDQLLGNARMSYASAVDAYGRAGAPRPAITASDRERAVPGLKRE